MDCCDDIEKIIKKECIECFKKSDVNMSYKRLPLKWHILKNGKLLLIEYALTNSLFTALEAISCMSKYAQGHYDVTPVEKIMRNEPLFNLLLNHGLLLNPSNDESDGLIRFLIRYSSENIMNMAIQFLQKRNWKFTNGSHVIFYAISIDSRASEYIFKKTDCTNVRDPQGNTPLIIFIKRGELRKVEDLLENGADYSLVDNAGYDALYYAMQLRDISCCAHLLSHIGIIKRNDYDGTTLLHMAKSYMLFKLLLKHGAVYKKNNNGEYPYDSLIKDGYYYTASAIIEDIHVYDILLL